MRVMITGAAGFVGAHLVAAAVRRPGVSAVLATDLTEGTGGGIVAHRVLDVTDRAAVRSAVAGFAPDVVVHAAAITPTAAQEENDARRVARVNAEGTFTVLAAAMARPGLRRAVLISSSAVFGTAPRAEPVTEDTPPAPASLYAATKVAAENIALRLGRERGVETLVVRLAAVYGEGERTRPTRPVTSHVHRLAAAPAPVRVAGGGMTRDFVHAEDAAGAVAALLDAPLRGHALVHVGGGKPVTWDRLLTAFRQAGRDVVEGAPASITAVPADTRPVFALDRLRSLIPYAPRPIEDGVRALVAP